MWNGLGSRKNNSALISRDLNQYLYVMLKIIQKNP
jgi:hypothetical protein